MTRLAAAPPERRAPRWLTRHETLLAAVLIVALAILGAYNDRFLTLDNLLNQGRLMAEVGLIAMPMTFVIITGGIDLSVGSVVGLSRDRARLQLEEPRRSAARRDRDRDRARRRSPASSTASSSRA